MTKTAVIIILPKTWLLTRIIRMHLRTKSKRFFFFFSPQCRLLGGCIPNASSRSNDQLQYSYLCENEIKTFLDFSNFMSDYFFLHLKMQKIIRCGKKLWNINKIVFDQTISRGDRLSFPNASSQSKDPIAVQLSM